MMFIHNGNCILCDKQTTKKRIHWCEDKFHYILYYHALFIGNPVNSKLLLELLTGSDNPYRIQRNRYYKLKPILETNGMIVTEKKNLMDGRTIGLKFTEIGIIQLKEIIDNYAKFITINCINNDLMQYKSEIFEYISEKIDVDVSRIHVPQL